MSKVGSQLLCSVLFSSLEMSEGLGDLPDTTQDRVIAKARDGLYGTVFVLCRELPQPTRWVVLSSLFQFLQMLAFTCVLRDSVQ